MYFHFRSKHALALAVIDDQTTETSEDVADLLSRKFSGLETLIDFSYQLAVRDITEDIARAGFNLLESIGRVEGLQVSQLGAWIQTLAGIVERAIAEGDILDGWDPHDVGRLLVSIYMGLRQTSNLDEAGAVPLDTSRRTGPWCSPASCVRTGSITSSNSSGDARQSRSAVPRRWQVPADRDAGQASRDQSGSDRRLLGFPAE